MTYLHGKENCMKSESGTLELYLYKQTDRETLRFVNKSRDRRKVISRKQFNKDKNLIKTSLYSE